MRTSDTGWYDSLDNDFICLRDIPLLQILRTNVIRTWGIEPSLNHSGCMNRLGNAGIYVLADLMTVGFTISTKNPGWNDMLYNHYTSVIDEMQQYPNLLGFIVGDDVINGVGTNDSGPYVKAAVRDMKAYIRQKGYRPIPIGYIGSLISNAYAAGWSQTGPKSANYIPEYLNCGDPSDAIDLWGFDLSLRSVNYSLANNYLSAYGLPILSNYSVPVFVAAYGWFTNASFLEPALVRNISDNASDISLLFGEQMSSIWSGGLIYQFKSQPNDGVYGLISGGYYSNNRIVTNVAFEYVSRKMALVSPSSIELAKYTPTKTAAACPEDAAMSLPPNPKAAVSPISTQHPSKSRLSLGEKIGMGIALPIFIIAIGTVILLFQRARKRKYALQEQDRNAKWIRKELAANDIDPEAKGYGPQMADSTQRAEIEDTGIIREVAADECQRFEAPGDMPALPEPIYRSFEEEFLMRYSELVA